MFTNVSSSILKYTKVQFLRPSLPSPVFHCTALHLHLTPVLSKQRLSSTAKPPQTQIQIQKYTITQIHKHTNTQIHNYTNTQIHKYKNTKIHKYTNTQIHKYTNTQIHKYTNTNIAKHDKGIWRWHCGTWIIKILLNTQIHKYKHSKT